MHWHAQWIWSDQQDRRPFNQTVIARKSFELPAFSTATLAITADSQYRLFINGQWVEDGPCRSWPRHYQYDIIDVTTRLRPGRNVIVVEARHFGLATFHQVPLEAGMLAQLEVTTTSGDTLVIGSDASWRAQVSPAHEQFTARTCIQMELGEWYDATRALTGAMEADYDDSGWPAARAYYRAEDGPWQDLHPRDVRFLTREPIFPLCVTEANVVTNVCKTFAFDMKRLCYPADRSPNIMPIAGILSSVLVSECAQTIDVVTDSPWITTLTCNGQPVEDGKLNLQPGENLLTLTTKTAYGHGAFTIVLGAWQWDGITQRNPCDTASPHPWAFIGPFLTLDHVTNVNDTTHETLPDDLDAKMLPFSSAPNAEALCQLAGVLSQPVTDEFMLKESYLEFVTRREVRPADALLDDRSALLADNSAWTTVHPALDGDVELCLDLGKETVGWVTFELTAPAGTVIDAHLIEYRDGKLLQHTGSRNGFRYITHDGVNHFVSMKRRAGRYLFLTLREMRAPVRIRTVQMLQATYPVEQRGAFRCSDNTLNRIWEISAYTLRLCMEDTYTDCPLYEQTLWVGDARNESLYNAICFGAHDLTQRCLRLTAQSLDTLPLVGCQLPSGWDILLPAWSFLWVINVWDEYLACGDRDDLAELYPAVLQNLRAAQGYCTDRGLFSISAWNLFDWAGIDDINRTVLHNSLFLVGALEAALQCCAALGKDDATWLQAFRDELKIAILALWDEEKGSYPDAIRNDGSISPSICQHTSALALLYDVLPEGQRATALQNVIAPPEGMVQVGSPFALQYFLEALEQSGDAAHAVEIIRAKWQDMLECGATTCWETFRGWESTFPTRSHCHAWSSAPVYVFNRLVLGIIPVAPGAAEVVVSPHPLDLTWVDGATCSPRGDLRVAWRVQDGTLTLTITMPEGVNWRVEPNADWRGISRVVVNGEERPELVAQEAAR